MNRQDLWLTVIGEMEGRRQKGLQDYGVPVTADEAHDWLRDAEQEALDFLIYIRASREVMNKLQRRIGQLEEALMEALPFVTPSAGDLVRSSATVRDRCDRIRATRERLEKVLEQEGTGSTHLIRRLTDALKECIEDIASDCTPGDAQQVRNRYAALLSEVEDQ